jgi:hypothetical protein
VRNRWGYQEEERGVWSELSYLTGLKCARSDQNVLSAVYDLFFCTYFSPRYILLFYSKSKGPWHIPRANFSTKKNQGTCPWPTPGKGTIATTESVERVWSARSMSLIRVPSALAARTRTTRLPCPECISAHR